MLVNVSMLDRRDSKRYPIALPAELWAGQLHILGETVNISSRGLMMACSSDAVRIGTPVRVRIMNWPRPRRANRSLVLTVEGPIVRSGRGQIAVQRIRYRFSEG
jgi:hypothetical protein